ncbi:ArnT family glycosyltransferase [Rhizobium metallidurans]|uniref:4-amino-4-deoxy-L-arabinose transferase-like glycosyltransferase n=1 Tax=Rhizobium metallidurans TaxID=1265931 RepID=A0A7W6GAL1_9HYPH|nr:glycosyltransferase family 39 protein [Rhizobium metallidurans]MBB3964092.1 4-amino-4-deoxy-L-arabinose transferase-like glycosyltransferase [Rhizobium metallidurans]
MQSKTADAVKPLWIVLSIIICVLVLRQLVHQSMFFDGAIYASIARNLAGGAGSPWRLQFSETLFSIFAEHPPLMMWLEAIAFRLFGDTIAVEKCFSLMTLVASGFILLKIWRRLHVNDQDIRAAGPLALIMALVAGRVSWGFTNGMLENLLIVFTSLAIYCVVIAYGGTGAKSVALRSVLMVAAGILVALALMTKGLVGLFPLATPGIWWLAFRRQTLVSVIFDTLVMTATVAAFFAALWQLDDARDAIQRYLSIQLVPSLTGQRGSGGGNWNAVRAFVRVNAYPAILTLIVLLCDRRWGSRPELPRDIKQARRQTAVFLVLVGFSASLPLLVSPRVASFYFNPSLAYFSSAFAIASAPAVIRSLTALNETSSRRLLLGLIAALALSIILVGFNIGRPGADAETIANATRISDRVCPTTEGCERVVTVCGAAAEDWALYGYLQRRYKISLATADVAKGKYMVADDSCSVDASYRDTGLNLSKYRLLQR